MAQSKVTPATKEKIKEVKSFFEERLWQLDLDEFSRLKRALYRQLRILYLVVNGFVENRCLLVASALTYTSLLSLVPLLALMFSILKGFGVQNQIEPILYDKLSGGSEEVISRIIQYIGRTNVKTLGALGVGGLVVTAIFVIGNIEKAFNRIWGVHRPRSLGRKFSDYLSVLLICPLLFVAALGLTSSVQSAALVQSIKELPGVSYLVLGLAILSPYFLNWIALTFVYAYLPNTAVPLRSAIFGGVIAGTMWQVAQWGYVHFQVGVAKYNAIYGAFAQLPIFLVWLYLGWIIVLFGAVISYAHQNIRTYRKDFGGGGVPYSVKEELGLKLLILIGKSFYSENDPWSADGLSNRLDVPVRLVNEMLHQHCQSGILIPASKQDEEVYLLARPPENLRVDEIIETMRSYGGEPMSVGDAESEAPFRQVMDRVRESRRQTLSSITLKDILAERSD